MKKFTDSLFKILLFVLFNFVNSNINLDYWVGPTHEAALVVKFFCWGLLGIISTALFLPIIRKLELNNQKIGKYIYQVVTFPEEYFWISILLIGLQAKNINPIVKTQLFQLVIFIASEILRTTIVSKIMGYEYKDFEQKRLQKNAEAFISLFIVILIIFLIFIIRS